MLRQVFRQVVGVDFGSFIDAIFLPFLPFFGVLPLLHNCAGVQAVFIRKLNRWAQSIRMQQAV